IGFIPDREFSFDVSQLKVGEKILAQIILPENEAGMVVLSLRRADRERIWRTLEEKFQSGEPLAVRVTAANRGGLIAEFAGLEGFLPVSHLASKNYPKVEGGDVNKILIKLRSLVGQMLQVKVITFDRNTSKLIFSERAAGDEKMQQAIANLKVGEIIKVTVSGIVDFGVFVTFQPKDMEEEVEGLIHISEISWDRVDNLAAKFKVGESLDAMVISLDEGRVSLSLKRLTPDPWEANAKNLKVGKAVKGEVTRLSPYGGFVRLAASVEGLIHRDAMTKSLEVGKLYEFTITEINEKGHKITLGMAKTPLPKTKKSGTTKVAKAKTAKKAA
ncbi:30S ribosomal protein S1, partial [Candidatus Berkelbacteria bacterium]|nr:30S ribosomal protein S1 [Candidatus Berkelbacteria bacterium]